MSPTSRTIAGPITADVPGQDFTSTPAAGAVLFVNANHGTVTRDPDLPAYPFGSDVVLTPVPDAGYTFIELLVVSTIVLILASAVQPLAKVTIQRTREAELRRVLREMRTAIDKFKDAADNGVISPLDLPAGGDNYPKDLQQLVDGVAVQNDASGKKLRFLRRIPIDPMTNSAEWKLRASQDDPKSTVWGGTNVFDVSSKSMGKALDGTFYKDWD